MRTTLTIDDDVLGAAKELAEREGKTIGAVISELARQSLRPRKPLKTRNGVTLLPTHPDDKPVTAELVNKLLDELP